LRGLQNLVLAAPRLALPIAAKWHAVRFCWRLPEASTP
jgi:hypothetical protein